MVLDRVRVGLTGATGMLGRHIHAALEAAGARVVPVSRSGRDGAAQWDLVEWLAADTLDALFGEVHAVVHAGAIVDSGTTGIEARVFDVNVRACANLAEWAVSRSTPLVFISSASVYADPDSGHLPEIALLGPNQVGGFYGMTKLMAEDILNSYRARGLKLAVVRPSSLYGYGGPESKMLYKFLNLAARGETIDLVPPVEDRIDFLHAADLSSAVVGVLERACWATVNVASERPVSVRELALACIKVTGRGRVRVAVTDSSERPPLSRFFLDATVARDRLGWTSTIGILQGLGMVLSGQLVAGHVSDQMA
jgi:UDP-glucose 4-epimerase